MEIRLEKVQPMLEEMKNLNNDEIFWLIRNISYELVSYYDADHKGQIYDGSYDQIQIEQATRLQQRLRTIADIMNQVFNHRNFDNDYFEDLLTDGYDSKLKEQTKIAKEYKEKAWKYDQLCD